ncbi:MAG: DNA-protecting protein DprA [Betaproteobacteria bacterium]|nr:DNA-protecting protein DprA [Betaproteobacteria bacterium]
MALDRDLEPWLRLSLLPGLGDLAFRRLLAVFGSPEEILAADHASLSKIVPGKVASAICNGGAGDRLTVAANWLEDPSNHLITLADETYPGALLQIADPPPVLYVKGMVNVLNQPALAIVGSRHATPQGVAIAESLATALSAAGLTIVSGLALGIDAAAHRGGLAGRASSVAVVGTGLDIVYPARNRALAHELAAKGALVSEFQPGTPPLGANFPRRNRLISGLARGCLVVEAAAHSGSLITARLANDQGREVFAVPGSIHAPLAKGCHQLIREGAKLVETAQDVLEELGIVVMPAPAPSASHETDTHAREILDHIGFAPCDIDTLSARSGLASDLVASLLTQLEIKGVIAALPGGIYQRIR